MCVFCILILRVAIKFIFFKIISHCGDYSVGPKHI